MITNWDEVKKRQEVLTQELSLAHIESSKRIQLQKELSALTEHIRLHDAVIKSQQDLKQAQEALAQSSSDTEMAALYQEEIVELIKKVHEQEAALVDAMFPADPLDDRSIFLEIRPGAGGQEAALFAADMLRMYTNYALKNRWKVSIVSMSETDLGGFREAIVHIEGKKVYGHLKFESGVHRVQRVPKTETQGRVHTSTVTVAVLPEAEEVELNINPADLRIDVFRAGGAGGQHVNKTESAVRITHIPTGTVVTCQDDRSQHKNKATALKVLKSRILAAQAEQHEAEMSQKRKAQVGMGMRAEKVRTYNFPQNRITDHQIDFNAKNLDMVMEGQLEDLVAALIDKERELRRAGADLKTGAL